jgi:hypothetical protein
MSLSGLALLITAVGALRAVAPDWVRVEMAPREPLKLAESAGKVLVAVYIGDEVATVAGRRGWFETGSRTVELALQILLPPEVEATIGGQTLTFETHEAGAEPVFAAVDGLIARAFGTPEAGAWGERWAEFVEKISDDIECRPFIAGETPSARLPGLDMSIPCQVIGPPAPGDAAPVWLNLVAMMRADAYFDVQAGFVEAMIRGETVPPWRIELARAGLTRAEGTALGIGVLAGLDDQPPVTRLAVRTPLRDVVAEVEP